MKRIIVFTGVLIAAMSFISCSNNDGNDSQNPDKIIGKWRLSQLFINNVDMQVSECEKMMTIEVFENGTYVEKDFEYDDAFTDCVLYDLINGTWESMGNSMYKMSGLNTSSIKVTFDGNKMMAEYSEIEEGITFSIKTIFIVDEAVILDQIIGNWKLVQEFYNGEEMPLSDCDLMGTFEFLEDGLFLEKEYEYDDITTECTASDTKTRIWKNIGESTYILYKLDEDNAEEQAKITFETDKMTVELSLDEDGVTYMARLVFNKVS